MRKPSKKELEEKNDMIYDALVEEVLASGAITDNTIVVFGRLHDGKTDAIEVFTNYEYLLFDQDLSVVLSDIRPLEGPSHIEKHLDAVSGSSAGIQFETNRFEVPLTKDKTLVYFYPDDMIYKEDILKLADVMKVLLRSNILSHLRP